MAPTCTPLHPLGRKPTLKIQCAVMANGTEVFSPCMSAAARQFWVMELKEILGRKRKGGKIGGGMKETEWEGTDGVDE